MDAKNYHAWAQRQGVIRQYGLAVCGGASAELGYVSHVLDADGRNNSAWNHRALVCSLEAAEGKLEVCAVCSTYPW